MSIHPARRATLSFLLVILSCLVPASAARAQEPQSVTLRLVSQTSFTTPKHPILHVKVDAANTSGETLDDLSVGIQIGQPIRSRTQFEDSLTLGPGASPLFALPFPQKGTLSSGETRRFAVTLDVTTAHLSSDDSLVYPAQVDLRTGVTPVAVLNTALVHVVRTPEQPLRFAWWAEITAPPPLDPAGRLADPAFETSIAPDGSLGSEVEALRRQATDPRRGGPIDLVLQPSVIDVLARMADGYERADGTTVAAGSGGAADARSLLSSIAEIAAAPDVQVSAMPFAAPLIPSLLSSALSPDLETQQALADQIIFEQLGIHPVPSVARPPQGAMDEASVDALARDGVTTILADADTVDRPLQENGFAPLPTATLDTAAGSHVDLVLPDPGTVTLLEDPDLAADPVRAAQIIFGELATIWRESPAPSSPTVRGVALGLPAGLPAPFWGHALRRLRDASFLQPVHAQDFVQGVEPAGPATVLRSPSLAAFSRAYVDGIRAERRDIEALRSMLEPSNPEPDELERGLLLAEAGTYVGNELAGRVWIDEAHAAVDDVFSRARPLQSQVFTFTSGQGSIPLRMGDPGSTAVTLVVRLRSAWFRFPDGATQTVTLERPNQIVSFRVEATAGSQGHTIQMLVSSPSGRLLYQQALVVRTAAVSRIALVITVIAALGLVVLWTRRIRRRRRSAT